MSSSVFGAEDRRASQSSYLTGGAWRGYLKILSLAALLLVEVLALSLRFDTKTITTGASNKSAATGQATAATGADPIGTRAQWSSWLVAHSSMVPGLGATALLATLLFGGRRSLRGAGASALAVVLAGLRRPLHRAGGLCLGHRTGLRGGGSFVNVGAGLADRLGGAGPDGGYPSDRHGDSTGRLGAPGEAGISCRRGGPGRRDRGRRRRPAHRPVVATSGTWHSRLRPCPAWTGLHQSRVRAIPFCGGDRFLRGRDRIAMLGLRRHRPGLGLPGRLHLVLPAGSFGSPRRGCCCRSEPGPSGWPTW